MNNTFQNTKYYQCLLTKSYFYGVEEQLDNTVVQTKFKYPQESFIQKRIQPCPEGDTALRAPNRVGEAKRDGSAALSSKVARRVAFIPSDYAHTMTYVDIKEENGKWKNWCIEAVFQIYPLSVEQIRNVQSS